MHERGLIHKDIKPANILVDKASGSAWLTGFGIASRLSREQLLPEPPQVIAGTLAYMAPEQTGRMNRSIDSRSDLYSLGVTFYELHTLPFAATDAIELIHCHFARQPVPPARLAAVPPQLSAIVMKLLAKTAEERYQTVAGFSCSSIPAVRSCARHWEFRHRRRGAGRQFYVRRGEIVVLAELEGQGQREILRGLAGAFTPQAGQFTKTAVDGAKLPYDSRRGITRCVANGVALIPENRKLDGLFLDLSIEQNCVIGQLHGMGLVRKTRPDAGLIFRLMATMQLRADPKQTVRSLSGGNQQKMMLGGWLHVKIDYCSLRNRRAASMSEPRLRSIVCFAISPTKEEPCFSSRAK